MKEYKAPMEKEKLRIYPYINIGSTGQWFGIRSADRFRPFGTLKSKNTIGAEIAEGFMSEMEADQYIKKNKCIRVQS